MYKIGFFFGNVKFYIVIEVFILLVYKSLFGI